MDAERFHQITSKTLCAEKCWKQKIHPHAQNKCLGHDRAVFFLDVCQTWLALLPRKLLRVAVKVEFDETA